MTGVSSLNGFSGLNAYYMYSRAGANGGTYGVQAAQRTAATSGQIPAVGAKKAAQPEAPVERVRPATPVNTNTAAQASRPVPTWNLNASEEAVRMRIQMPIGESGSDAARAELPADSTAAASAEPAWPSLPGSGEDAQEAAWPSLPGSGESAQAAGQPNGNSSEAAALTGNEKAWAALPNYPGVDAGETAARLRIQYPDDGSAAAQAVEADDGEAVNGAEAVQQAAEEGKCETCEKRKYQDGSDDPGVSYQTPTRIAPENAASAVRSHEMEHVFREQAKAQREDRHVVSQTVTLHTEICPECGKAYISGGTTRTVTAANPTEPEPAQQPEEPSAPSGLV